MENQPNWMKPEFSTVTTKGQLVIPARLRRKFKIRKGTRVAFEENGRSLILYPITAEYIHSLRGSAKGGRSALKILLRERKRDRVL